MPSCQTGKVSGEKELSWQEVAACRVASKAQALREKVKRLENSLQSLRGKLGAALAAKETIEEKVEELDKQLQQERISVLRERHAAARSQRLASRAEKASASLKAQNAQLAAELTEAKAERADVTSRYLAETSLSLQLASERDEFLSERDAARADAADAQCKLDASRVDAYLHHLRAQGLEGKLFQEQALRLASSVSLGHLRDGLGWLFATAAHLVSSNGVPGHDALEVMWASGGPIPAPPDLVAAVGSISLQSALRVACTEAGTRIAFTSVMSDRASIAARVHGQACLGAGGMGAVYAVQSGCGRRALKVAHAGQEAPLAVEAHVCVMHALSPHPRLVGGTPLVLPSGVPAALDMACAAEGCLSDVLPLALQHCGVDGVWQRAFARCIVIQVAEGLAYSHSTLALVHQDLKPCNVAVRSLDLPRAAADIALLDFGLAVTIGVSTGGFTGTSGYRAPEQHQPNGVHVYVETGAADVYALGVLALQLLAPGMRLPYASCAAWGADADMGQQFTGLHAPRLVLCGHASHAVICLVESMMLRDAAARPPLSHVLHELRRVAWEP